jgi:two-component sensor histidine kinase
MRQILNVDDTEALRYAKSRALKMAGFEVIEAGTGKDALDIIARVKPDLVLLDVKLPDMSGLDVCKVIKQAHPGTMVMQVSATFVGSTDRAKGLDVGADAYLTEPLSPEELVANVRALLRLKDAEAEKAALLRQKDLLFRELNHRVKNNLQLISSLLSVQSRRITDPRARAEFTTAQQRVRTIASLHSRLYRDDQGIGTVNVRHYLNELADQLRSLLLADRPDVSLVMKGDDFSIDIDRATSTGLIINELVSNAAKHAFADGQAGTIVVELGAKDGMCMLRVADDGRGEHDATGETEGIGLKLVDLFAQQMDGTVSREANPGLRITVRFPCAALMSSDDATNAAPPPP